MAKINYFKRAIDSRVIDSKLETVQALFLNTNSRTRGFCFNSKVQPNDNDTKIANVFNSFFKQNHRILELIGIALINSNPILGP